jgi:hypothetical protein
VNYILRPISTQENFPRKKKFVKCDWPTQIFQVENFQFLTMIFSENFLSVEMGLCYSRGKITTVLVDLCVKKITLIYINFSFDFLGLDNVDF